MKDSPRDVTRRDFLQAAGVTGLTLASLGIGQSGCDRGLDYSSLDPREPANFFRPLRIPGGSGPMGRVELPEVRRLTVTSTSLGVVEGQQTELLAFRAGDTDIYNPLLYGHQGDLVQLQMVNGLDEPTIIHWHGLHVPWEMDGHPAYQVASGEAYEYSFEIENRPGTYWYHPHPHGRTAIQSNIGLNGLLIVEGPDDLRLRDALGLTFALNEIPLVIQDRRLDDDAQLRYSPDHMEEFAGYLGDINLVNLTVNPTLEVSTGWYRFRILNGSNARTYRLAFASEGAAVPCLLAGTDGGLLAAPVVITEVFVSPGERVDLLLDISRFAMGDELFLRTLDFSAMENMGAMGGGQMRAISAETTDMMESMHSGASRISQGEAFHVMRLLVTEEVSPQGAPPETLSEIEPIGLSGAETRVIQLGVSPSNMMVWEINGETFRLDEYPIEIRRDSTEIWEVRNDIDSMPHPLHIHGPLFQVIDRTGSPSQVSELAVDEQGRLPTDLGYKDTVMVWPGESVRLAMRFVEMFPGAQTFLMHCHILEHEDMGMMINVRVT